MIPLFEMIVKLPIQNSESKVTPIGGAAPGCVSSRRRGVARFAICRGALCVARYRLIPWFAVVFLAPKSSDSASALTQRRIERLFLA